MTANPFTCSDFDKQYPPHGIQPYISIERTSRLVATCRHLFGRQSNLENRLECTNNGRRFMKRANAVQADRILELERDNAVLASRIEDARTPGGALDLGKALTQRDADNAILRDRAKDMREQAIDITAENKRLSLLVQAWYANARLRGLCPSNIAVDDAGNGDPFYPHDEIMGRGAAGRMREEGERLRSALCDLTAEVERNEDWLGQLANVVGIEDGPDDADDFTTLRKRIYDLGVGTRTDAPSVQYWKDQVSILRSNERRLVGVIKRANVDRDSYKTHASLLDVANVSVREDLERTKAYRNSARARADRADETIDSLRRAMDVLKQERMSHERHDKGEILRLKGQLKDARIASGNDALRESNDDLRGILSTTADRLNTALREAGIPGEQVGSDYETSFAIRNGIVALYDNGARLREEVAQLQGKGDFCVGVLSDFGGQLLSEKSALRQQIEGLRERVDYYEKALCLPGYPLRLQGGATTGVIQQVRVAELCEERDALCEEAEGHKAERDRVDTLYQGQINRLRREGENARARLQNCRESLERCAISGYGDMPTDKVRHIAAHGKAWDRPDARRELDRRQVLEETKGE